MEEVFKHLKLGEWESIPRVPSFKDKDLIKIITPFEARRIIKNPKLINTSSNLRKWAFKKQ